MGYGDSSGGGAITVGVPKADFDAEVAARLSDKAETLQQFISTNYLKYDGSTETSTLSNLLNKSDNATIYLKTGTVIIDDLIIVTKNNVTVICEDGFIVKVKDESGIATKILNGTYNYNPPLILFLGNKNKWFGGEIDGNIAHNGLTLSSVYYQCYYLTGTNDLFAKCFGYGGIGISGNECVVDGVNIHDVGAIGVDIKSYDAIYNYGSRSVQNPTVRNCVITRCGRDAISLHFTAYADVHDNQITDTYWHDIHNYLFAHYSKIHDNIISYTDSNVTGLYPNHKTLQLKEDSIISGHELYIDGFSKYCRIFNNRVYSTQKRAIKIVDYQFNPMVVNNFVRSTDMGIKYGIINGNLVIKDNTVYDATQGISCTVDVAYAPPTGYTVAQISCNIQVEGNNVVNSLRPYVVDLHSAIVLAEINGGAIDIAGNNSATSDIPLVKEVVTFYNDGLTTPIKINVQPFKYFNYDKFLSIGRIPVYLYCDYVNGLDSNLGTLDSPFKTITNAVNFCTFPELYDYTIRLLNDDNSVIVITNKTISIEGYNSTLRKISSITTYNSNISYNFITLVSCVFYTSLIKCSASQIIGTNVGYAVICDFNSYMYFEGSISNVLNGFYARYNSRITANLSSQAYTGALACAKFGGYVALCNTVTSLVSIVETGSSVLNGKTVIYMA